MKLLLMGFLFLAFLSSASAQTKVFNGLYQVEVEPGVFANFCSSLSFDGASYFGASELAVRFPKTLVGDENVFVLTKENGDWTSQSDLFEKVECEQSEEFDLSCFLQFNKDNLRVVETEATMQLPLGMDPVLLASAEPVTDSRIFAASGATFSNKDILSINLPKARQNLVEAGLVDKELTLNLKAIDIFASEPIGWIRYASDGMCLEH